MKQPKPCTGFSYDNFDFIVTTACEFYKTKEKSFQGRFFSHLKKQEAQLGTAEAVHAVQGRIHTVLNSQRPKELKLMFNRDSSRNGEEYESKHA